MTSLRLVSIFALLLASSLALAAGTRYVMRVDGLACPYCAYGVEKKLKKIEGVEAIDVDLDRGLVTVEVREGVRLTDEQMTRLFKEAGFTFRSMRAEPR
jgi:mercuric ion binding protein